METKNLRYLAILFGGILIVDWLLSFGLTTDATYHLTKASIDAAVVVAVVGFIFRSRLNLKIVLIATGLLSVSLIFWLFSVSNARAVSHVTRPQPHPDTDWGPEEPPEEVVIDSVERSDRIWRVVLHSPSKEFVITCTDTPAWGDCKVPKVGESWRVDVDDNGRILRLRGPNDQNYFLWDIQRVTLLQQGQ